MSIAMSIEQVMICDNCSAIIAGESTIGRLRDTAYKQCGAQRLNRLDYCKDCLERGYPKNVKRL